MKIDITRFDPCGDGRDYYDSCSSFEEAWEKCPRGDWMLWAAFKLGVDKRVLTLAKGLCANTVRHLMKDDRSVKAVDAAIAYGEGRIDETELEAAADAARAAGADAWADAADAADAARAAGAAGAAARAAWAAAGAAARAAAWYTADAAWYAAAAAWYARAARAAGTNNRKLTANIYREVLTDSVLKYSGPRH